MKKYLSVFSLIARNSIYRIVGLLLLLVVADCVLAWYWISVLGYDLSNLFRNGNGGFGIALAVIFAAIAVVQLRRGDMYSGAQGYTMQRLAISEKAVALLQILYHILCWLILWGVQVLTIFLICNAYYRFGLGNPLTRQYIFHLFYISPLLHSLLPMEEILVWLANAAMVVGISVATTYGMIRRRGKKPAGEVIPVIFLVIVIFRRELGSFFFNVMTALGYLALTVICGYRIFFRKKEV